MPGFSVCARRPRLPVTWQLAGALDLQSGLDELATSETMQPYLQFLKAGLQNKDTTPLVEEIAQLPLEKRYIWRVASALKWGFADFDSVYVPVDLETLSAENLRKVIELLRLRPLQFCIFGR